MALEGSERKVLHVIMHEQGGSQAGYVEDSKIAEIAYLSVEEVRDCLETLEEKECVQRSIGVGGHSAYVTAKGRQELRRVFISYSWDSVDHTGRVLELADALRGRGIDVILDQYVHPDPDEGWPRWMDRNLDEAKFVVMVCTETYRRRVMGLEEPGKGFGVRWEGSLIYNRIYNDKPSASRFIPILLLPGSGHGSKALTVTDFGGGS